MKIGVTEAGILDVDENLIGTRLRNGYLLVLDFTAGLLDDLSPLLCGNFRCHSAGETLNGTGM